MDPASDSDARASAVRYVSHREHSQAELRLKLGRRGFEPDVIESAIASLVEMGLQDDARFAGQWVRSRMGRGFGPLKIRAELARKGVGDGDAAAALSEHEHEWLEVARRWLDRHGGIPESDDRNARASAYRRLCNRGFPHDISMQAIRAAD